MIKKLTLVWLSCNVVCLTASENMQEKLDTVHYQGTYPSDHWALQPATFDNQYVVALAYYKELEFSIYLNPTDKRGYRFIVCLQNAKNMASTFNRDYTPKEMLALSLVLGLAATAFKKIVPVVQISMAGNNAHNFDEKTDVTNIGKAKEPSLLHAHLYGRGNPQKEYVPGVQLEGPPPGHIFDMRGQTPHVRGNGTKVTWEDREVHAVVSALRTEIDQVAPLYHAFGLTVKSSK